jgi:hypothetical protein
MEDRPANAENATATSEQGERRQTNYGVSPEAFVMAFEEANTVSDVAEKLAIPIPIVHARASVYRRLGVKLKKLKRRKSSSVDVDRLNKLLESRRRSPSREAQAGDPPR